MEVREDIFCVRQNVIKNLCVSMREFSTVCVCVCASVTCVCIHLCIQTCVWGNVCVHESCCQWFPCPLTY